MRDLKSMIGRDGFVTLALSVAVAVATLGASVLWQLSHVVRLARGPVPAGLSPDLIVVLGFRLKGERVAAPFATRLERTARLYHARAGRRVLILGGRPTSGRVSEAEAGRRHLLARDVPGEAIRIEERSAHTLENLRFGRALLAADGGRPFLLVTSRTHLARSVAMAEGLGLRPIPCPAEDAFHATPATVLQCLREAFFLHWYRVGERFSLWTRNQRSLARIR